MKNQRRRIESLDGAQVGKANALIDASYRLSLQEQRIILAAISQVARNEEVTDEVMYTIEIQSLADLADIPVDTAYTKLKEAARRLKSRNVRLEFAPNTGEQLAEPLDTVWVQTIAYVDSKARIRLRFGRDILPYLNQLSGQFTLYKLKHVARMNSPHAIRLYEMIVRWRNTGNRCEISLDELKRALMIEADYPRIFDLKKRVIDPSIKQINKHSDLHVTVGYRKTGRKVTHVQFQFEKAKSQEELSRPQKRKQNSATAFPSEYENIGAGARFQKIDTDEIWVKNEDGFLLSETVSGAIAPAQAKKMYKAGKLQTID